MNIKIMDKYVVDICQYSNGNVVMLPKSISKYTRPARKETICISEGLYDLLETTTCEEAKELGDKYRDLFIKN